jgi:DNA-binding FadR family transcriptional regulator
MISGDSRPEIVARRIAEIAETLPSGARLGSKAEVQALVDVSAGTLNTTLRLLQSRGLIRVKSGPGGGIFVTEQSSIARLGDAVLQLDSNAVNIPDAIQVRNGLEYEIVNDACIYGTREDIAELTLILEDMRRAFNDNDEDGFVRINWGLHRRIAQISRNGTLKSLYLGLLDFIESHTLRVVAHSGQGLHEFHEKRLQIHADLVKVIADRDVQSANGVARTHNLGISAERGA